MLDISIIIPSLNPDEKLIQVVDAVLAKGFKDIIIVNDGSSSEYDKYFNIINEHPECTILKNYKNLGKGRSLKTAFNYFLNNRPNSKGLVTVDADNQHHADDIYKCAEALLDNQDSLILGCRNFNDENVPFKSKYGNKITRTIFKILCGINVSDTQTGLRALSPKLAKEFMDIDGERYEYETNMLIECKKRNIDIKEVPIRTIYIEENKSSHFNPFRDSLKIYSLILKFFSNSIISSIIDIGLFTLFMILFKGLNISTKLLISTVLARICSSLFNFFINKNVVFNNQSNLKSTMTKYYILSTIQMACSYIGVYGFTILCQNMNFYLNTSIIKILVDLVLFIISFQIQREWVFKNS